MSHTGLETYKFGVSQGANSNKVQNVLQQIYTSESKAISNMIDHERMMRPPWAPHEVREIFAEDAEILKAWMQALENPQDEGADSWMRKRLGSRMKSSN